MDETPSPAATPNSATPRTDEQEIDLTTHISIEGLFPNKKKVIKYVPSRLARELEADNARLREVLRIIDVARRDESTARPDAYELWEIRLTRGESAKVRAALAEGGVK